MKKADVLQLAIVMMGIVYGFVALQYLISSLYGIFLWIFEGGYGGGGYLSSSISIFAAVGLQVVCSWLLITKSEKLASYFYQKSELGTGFKVVSKPTDLLHILLLVIGFYLLLSKLSPFLTAIFNSFKERAPGGGFNQFEDSRPVNWVELILNIILPLILLAFAKPIAEYFSKNISDEPISIEESFDHAEITESTED